MNRIENQRFDEERALYGQTDLIVSGCLFDGPKDGESAFKECANIQIDESYFHLRYPFWHDQGLKINHSVLTEKCRAALWYSNQIEINDTKLHGIKACRECSDVRLNNCDILSDEFGWSVNHMEMMDCHAESEYFIMRSSHLKFQNVHMKGKYSFQYIEDAEFENCIFDTKDAFWHAKNIVVRNSVVKGEYLAWYSENITFENCRIIGTQPLCYCRNLRLIHCEMIDTDLAFERSDVEATIISPMISIKNPLSGHIYVPSVRQLIYDIPNAEGEVIFQPQTYMNQDCSQSIIADL